MPFLDGSYEAAIRAEEGEDGSQDTENVRPTELVTQYEVSKPQLEEVIACLNTFVTTDHETPEEKEAALQAAYETLDAYLNASQCLPSAGVIGNAGKRIRAAGSRKDRHRERSAGIWLEV